MAVPKSPIRQLSWDYYLGKVEPREEYLRRRRLLVDALINGDPVPSFESPDQTSLNFGDDGDLTATPLTTAPQATAHIDEAVGGTAPTGSRRPQAAIIAASVTIAILTFAFLYPFQREVDQSPSANKPATDTVIRNAPILPASLQQPLETLHQHGWDSQVASDFLAEWSQQNAEMKEQLQELPTISAVTELVASRAAELVTMASAGVTIDAHEREQIEALSAALSLPQVRWPEPPEQLAALPALEAEPLLGITPDISPSATADETTVSTSTAPENQPPATALTEQRNDMTSANQPNDTSDKANPLPAAAAIKTTPQPSSSEMNDEQSTAVHPPAPTRETVRKERPASIVLSERNGCSADLINYRARTCRDFLSSRVRAPKMAVIPAGTYKMGNARYPSESPVTEVTIPSVLAFSTHEISFQDFLLYCKNSGADCPANPGNDKQLPVVGVSWQEAVDYTAWLSSRTGNHYRLPSEAEWEYAARAGSSSIYPFGDTLMVTQARFSTPNREATSPLANSYQAINPNDYHLYHMVGNVREWVADHWQDHHDSVISNGGARTGTGQRVVRGGSYADNAEQLRSSARQPLDQGTRDRFTGFRVVLDFSAKTP